MGRHSPGPERDHDLRERLRHPADHRGRDAHRHHPVLRDGRLLRQPRARPALTVQPAGWSGPQRPASGPPLPPSQLALRRRLGHRGDPAPVRSARQRRLRSPRPRGRLRGDLPPSGAHHHAGAQRGRDRLCVRARRRHGRQPHGQRPRGARPSQRRRHEHQRPVRPHLRRGGAVARRDVHRRTAQLPHRPHDTPPLGATGWSHAVDLHAQRQQQRPLQPVAGRRARGRCHLHRGGSRQAAPLPDPALVAARGAGDHLGRDGDG